MDRYNSPASFKRFDVLNEAPFTVHVDTETTPPNAFVVQAAGSGDWHRSWGGRIFNTDIKRKTFKINITTVDGAGNTAWIPIQPYVIDLGNGKMFECAPIIHAQQKYPTLVKLVGDKIRYYYCTLDGNVAQLDTAAVAPILMSLNAPEPPLP